jgi:hypothetical protein
MKQTAVEWLEEQTRKPEWHSLKRQDIFEQANELFEQQIIDFGVWYSGMEQEKVKKAFETYKKETT